MITPIHTSPATKAEWVAAVERSLGGASFESLVQRSYDGVPIEPIYAAIDSQPRAFRQKPGAWRVVQRVDHPNPDIAIDLARAAIEGGANGLSIVSAGSPIGFGFGLHPRDTIAVARELAQPDLYLRLEGDADGLDLMEVSPSLKGAWDLGIDPIGAFAGQQEQDKIPSVMKYAFGKVSDLVEVGFSGCVMRADGRRYHADGASEAQELAFVLATGVAYLRGLESVVPLDRARKALSFALATDTDIFLTIAKFRAFRRLWANIEILCGLEACPLHLHAETAWRMLIAAEPSTNIPRNALAAFAAGIGGADSLSVLPHTAPTGLADWEDRRLACNLQLILLEESHLGHVADPTAGAGAFETLTNALARAAWGLFQAIEGQGGIVERHRQGTIQMEIADMRAKREADAMMGRAPIVGASIHATADKSRTIARQRNQDRDLGWPTPRRLSEAFEITTGEEIRQ